MSDSELNLVSTREMSIVDVQTGSDSADEQLINTVSVPQTNNNLRVAQNIVLNIRPHSALTEAIDGALSQHTLIKAQSLVTQLTVKLTRVPLWTTLT